MSSASLATSLDKQAKQDHMLKQAVLQLCLCCPELTWKIDQENKCWEGASLVQAGLYDSRERTSRVMEGSQKEKFHCKQE